MEKPSIPANESERVRALRAYEVLDTPPERTFGALTRLVAYVLDVPISLVSLVDADRQWFKARHGIDATEGPRDSSFCGHVVGLDGPLVVCDARDDPRFFDNPAVTGGDRIRFYAGVPIRTAEGYVVGSLCAVDRKPRSVSPERLELLDGLARQAVDLLELRRDRRRAARELASLDLYRRHFDLFPALLGVLDDRLALVDTNDGFDTILGWPEKTLHGLSLVDLLHPEDRKGTATALASLVRGEVSSMRRRVRLKHCENDFTTVVLGAKVADGRVHVQAYEV